MPPLSLLQAALAQDPRNGLTGIQLILELNYQPKGSPLTINDAVELADPPNGVATVEADFQGHHSGYFWVVARDRCGGVAWEEIDQQI